MKKQEIYELLKRKNICHEITEHPAVFSMEELPTIHIPYPDAVAKNLFVRDDKKKNYYLITVKGDKRVDLKAFRKEKGTRPLSFAAEEELKEIMQLLPGEVTPFGILNDEERRVKLFFDNSFFDFDGIIGVHPNENTATIWIQAKDLVDIIREHGNEVEIISQKTKKDD